MTGLGTPAIPKIKSIESTETIISNSQSPTFADFRSLSENETNWNFLKCQQRTQALKLPNAQKRPQPGPSIPLTNFDIHTTKKLREDSIPLKKRIALLSDYGWEIQENEKRIKTIRSSNIDIYEMYHMLCKSTSLIPVPHTLLLDDSEVPDSKKHDQVCRNFSIDDRKQTLLNLFSRRFSLKVSSETLHLGAALLDKCLDVMIVNKETLKELAAVTLVIASKFEDVNCLTIGSVVDIDLIRNKSVSMIASLERFVLASLSFRVTIPTPLHFATYMLVYLSGSPAIINLTYYLLELSLLFVHNRLFASDVVANAATCLAFAIEPNVCDFLHSTNSPTILRETEKRLCGLTGTCNEELRNQKKEVMMTLTDLFLVASETHHDIFREYCTTRRHNVALRRIDPNLLSILRSDLL